QWPRAIPADAAYRALPLGLGRLSPNAAGTTRAPPNRGTAKPVARTPRDTETASRAQRPDMSGAWRWAGARPGSTSFGPESSCPGPRSPPATAARVGVDVR